MREYVKMEDLICGGMKEDTNYNIRDNNESFKIIGKHIVDLTFNDINAEDGYFLKALVKKYNEVLNKITMMSSIYNDKEFSLLVNDNEELVECINELYVINKLIIDIVVKLVPYNAIYKKDLLIELIRKDKYDNIILNSEDDSLNQLISICQKSLNEFNESRRIVSNFKNGSQSMFKLLEKRIEKIYFDKETMHSINSLSNMMSSLKNIVYSINKVNETSLKSLENKQKYIELKSKIVEIVRVKHIITELSEVL